MAQTITVKSKNECRWDLVSLGEVMLRLDPGEKRIHTTRNFQVWEGGGEYNVARGLKRCFGMDAAIVTALADNPVGRLIEDLIYQGGVDHSHLKWVNYDGVGRIVRNGLNFTEAGFGIRAALGCSDRGNTAVSQLKKGGIDWHKIFGAEGARWFHTGGIFCALSESTPEVAIEAMKIAKEYGTIISYDLNYRESLWKSIGGKPKAQEVNRELSKYVDVMIGVEKLDEEHSKFDTANVQAAIEKTIADYPNFKAVATTLRNVKTASLNDWSAVCYTDGKLYQSARYENLQILDRVGGGDSFASGLIYGFLTERGAEWAVNCGAAHGALAMTTPGDTSMVSLAEVERVMQGGGARVAR